MAQDIAYFATTMRMTITAKVAHIMKPKEH
jgi:hypothetical protein